jgi:serine acetyltransferase
VGDGVMIGANASVLGNIRIGEYSKVGAGSVVVADVPPHSTVVGVPAKTVGKSVDKPRRGNGSAHLGAAHHSSRGNLLIQNALLHQGRLKR